MEHQIVLWNACFSQLFHKPQSLSGFWRNDGDVIVPLQIRVINSVPAQTEFLFRETLESSEFYRECRAKQFLRQGILIKHSGSNALLPHHVTYLRNPVGTSHIANPKFGLGLELSDEFTVTSFTFSRWFSCAWRVHSKPCILHTAIHCTSAAASSSPSSSFILTNRNMHV